MKRGSKPCQPKSWPAVWQALQDILLAAFLIMEDPTAIIYPTKKQRKNGLIG